MKAHTKLSDIENSLAVNIQYGMAIVRQGSRYVGVWSEANLRRFIVEHVLLHEVGHHVHFWQRKQQGYAYRANAAGHEQFANDYAMRWRKVINCTHK